MPSRDRGKAALRQTQSQGDGVVRLRRESLWPG